MGAKRTEYQIVGRYMNGKEVTAYHLQSIETGKAGRYSREQVAYLVGRDQVTNCVGQIYQDKLLLRGKGMSLEDLPVQQEDGTLKRTDNIGKIRKGTSAANAMEQWMIVGTLKAGRNTVGYVVQNAGCGIKKVKRQQVIELAKVGKIGNARVQTYQGKELLRGVGVNLDELPSENINSPADTADTADTHSQKNVTLEKHKEMIKIIVSYATRMHIKIEPAKVDGSRNCKKWNTNKGWITYTIKDRNGGFDFSWMESGTDSNSYSGNIVEDFDKLKEFVYNSLFTIKNLDN